MSGKIILFEKHNGAWLPRNYLPALDKGVIGGIIGGDLSLTATALIFESKGGSDNITISLKTISSFQEAELGFGRDGGGDGVGSICIKTHDSKEMQFKVSDPKKWLMELERCIGKGTSADMNMMETDSSNSELKNTCKRCGKIWYLDADELQDLENRLGTAQGAMQTMGRLNLFGALFNPSLAAQGTTTMAANTGALKSLADELNTKSRCPECQSKHIDRVLVDMNEDVIGEAAPIEEKKGMTKINELEKLAKMKEKGLIDDAEFKQMKKEILGK
jgi:hypothetical protein